MSFLLKEALKSLCGENGWSYAVFWKIGCRNPTILVWEEGHYDPVRCSSLPSVSGSGSTESLLKQWELLWNSSADQDGQVNCQTDDGIGILINKMMQQVHFIGEGIVGHAALTGNHQWILLGTHVNYGSMSKGQTEVHHQFLAGIQTIAVIPLLPYGVIQLGTTRMIKENIGFLNHVKILFLQLANVPGALMSGNIEKALVQRIQPQCLLGVAVGADQSQNISASVATLACFSGNSCDKQLLSSPVSRLVSQSGSLLPQVHDDSQTNASLLPLNSIPTGTAVAPSNCDMLLPKAVQMVRPNFPIRTQPESKSMGSRAVFSSPEVQLNSQAAPHFSGSRNTQPTVSGIGVHCSNILCVQKQSLSAVDLWEQASNNVPTSNGTKSPQLISQECTIPCSLKDSVIVSLLAKSELPGMGGNLGSSSSTASGAWRSVDSKSSCLPLQGTELQSGNSSGMGLLSLSNHPNHSCGHLSSQGSQVSHPTPIVNHTQTKSAKELHNIQSSLFQPHVSPPAPGSNEHSSWFETIPDLIQDCLTTARLKPDEDNKKIQFTFSERSDTSATYCVKKEESSDDHQSLNSSSERTSDASLHLAEGDLFDALGAQLKTKQVNASSDDMVRDASDANAQSLSTDISTCISQLVAAPFFDGMNDGISESGIFSQTGTDYLLDAVVSKTNSISKQNLDDNVSCKTKLTKMSSSSFCTNSSLYHGGTALEPIRVELFDHCRRLVKPEIAALGSFKTACSLDKAGECSQSGSTYKSQISSWIDDGQNVRRDSILTGNSKRADETGKTNRKRPRPGESSRPRPKDRQMIQDRVKELREIVPNGAKCSIDALLERTIKHMLFLQSVTKHADKLKQSGESKIISKEGSLLLKDNFEGGATWAFEVGSQSMVCPIIVEDLNPPRQMLVEMLCEERGFFLEIADLIRGLGLTILKGVMEARSDKVWARFAVEANRDVTRMDIFLSLVHLLEQTMKSSKSPKSIDSGNVFHQSSIPCDQLG